MQCDPGHIRTDMAGPKAPGSAEDGELPTGDGNRVSHALHAVRTEESRTTPPPASADTTTGSGGRVVGQSGGR